MVASIRIAPLAVLAALAPAARAAPAEDRARAEIVAFNKAFDEATRRMDTPALLAAWADDGISLLPKTAPIVGKAAIGKFFDGVMAQMKGAKMKLFEDTCHDIEVSGPWASEWCEEHQVVELPGGKPPFDGRGKLLLVLHKGSDGAWKIAREMWNEAAPPT